jgi:hypothetical protein
MRLFVDTEFTDFINCDLISIALAADDGREFYGERSDYDDASCTAFVREAVIAQLASIRPELLAWLAQFDGEQGRMLCFDYAGDWDLFVDLIGDVPDGWLACSLPGSATAG